MNKQLIITKRNLLLLIVTSLVIAIIVIIGLLYFRVDNQQYAFNTITYVKKNTISPEVQNYDLNDINHSVSSTGINLNDYIGSSLDDFKGSQHFTVVSEDSYTFQTSNLRIMLFTEDNYVAAVGVRYVSQGKACSDDCYIFPKFPLPVSLGSHNIYSVNWYNNDKLGTSISFIRFVDLPLIQVQETYSVPVDPSLVNTGFIYGEIGDLTSKSYELFKWYTDQV